VISNGLKKQYALLRVVIRELRHYSDLVARARAGHPTAPEAKAKAVRRGGSCAARPVAVTHSYPRFRNPHDLRTNRLATLKHRATIQVLGQLSRVQSNEKKVVHLRDVTLQIA
jgi:hypothetical protein